MVEYISRDSFLVAYQFLHLKGLSSLDSILATLSLFWPLPLLVGINAREGRPVPYKH
jgi:hypothetical protein